MVSLLSLLTLKISIPALFHKGASARSTALLQLLLIVKVPIYAVGLYYAAKMGAAAAFAAFGGCTVVPCVISLEAIVRACIEADPKLKRAMAMVEPVTLMPAVEELSRQVAALKAEAAEPMPMPAQPQVRPVREGAA